MSRDELILLAKQIAVGKNLDPVLICAVIEQESNWDIYSIRHEPAFQIRYVIPLHLLDTETIARSMSWGLTQLMGESAREMGYKGYLSGLCDPQDNIEYGCRWFQTKLKRANNDIGKALTYWNGGINKQYPTQVIARMAKYR